MGQLGKNLHAATRTPRSIRASHRPRRRSRLRLLAMILPVLAVVLTAIPAASAGVAHASAGASNSPTLYAIGVPVCKPAPRGHSTCFVMRRVDVKKGTPGARSFRLGGGVSPNSVKTGPDQTIGPYGGLTPSDLATAYDFSSTATGSTQTVAIVDAYNDPNIDSDLQTFDSQYGLATCNETNGCLRVLSQTGSSTSLPPDDTSGWSVEESLDVETVHSVCQECKIILLEASSASNSDLAAAVDEAATLHATEISNSYGSPETTADEAAYNHPGIVVTVSAGDDGYYDYDLLGSDGAINAPNTPASFPTVVAVGGTSLYLGQTAARQSETVWNDNGVKDIWESYLGEQLGASGGGCSTLFPAEDWQSHMSVWSRTVCGTYRLVSDVAADADPLTGFDIYATYNCGDACSPLGWDTVGGTSLSSPIIASMYALAGGSHGVEYPALTLYGHLGSTSLYDVTVGGNGYCDGEGAAACGDPNNQGYGIVDCDYPATGNTQSVGDRTCDAETGYDGPTGVGTPIGLGAFAATGPTAAISGPTLVTGGRTNTWAVIATDPFPGGSVTTHTWKWGDGTANTVTSAGSATHDYTKSGVTETITLTVTDNYGQVGTKTYSVKVNT